MVASRESILGHDGARIVATEGIHMSAFAIGLYNIRDVSWRPAYREVVDTLVAKHGGRYVARTTNPWEVLEGAAPDVTNITMIEFPSMEHARAWYNDPDSLPMRRLRQAGSRLNMLLVEGSTSGRGSEHSSGATRA
jgi:uncharacterized protein (DUF1330 family)